MCGIAGIVAQGAQGYAATLQAMLDAIRHRGPDGAGKDFFPGCALGHTRLSIIDLESGAQPMRDSSGSRCLTFNGEIYGYREIRKRIDYPYQTHSDTEVLHALYRDHGTGMLEHLPGMFAFALWDEQRQRLFCARDRFGEKPFYYALGSNNELVFGSEIKAIVATGLVHPKLCYASLAHYLKKLYVPINGTIYKNIHVLPPAHSMLWEDGRITVRRYWELPPPSGRIAIDDAVEQFTALLDMAVRKQLVADVEVGAFLSGGLDSTTIVGVAAKHQPGLHTIGFGFGWGVNELPYARAAANAYGTNHTEIFDKDIPLADLLTRMPQVFDEPFADSSNIPMYAISQHAAQQLKVVLTGDGGDELLGGYDFWYKPLYHLKRYTEGQRLRYMLMFLLARVARNLNQSWRPVIQAIIQAEKTINRHQDVTEAHRGQGCFFSDTEISALGLEPPGIPPTPTLYGGVDNAFRMDLGDYMPGDILTKTDRASMANSLELRAPFLDVEFASFVIGLPEALKIDRRSDKRILREALSTTWPASIRTRQKTGFGAPVGAWLKRPDMQDLKADYLYSQSLKLYGLLDPRQVSGIIARGDYQTWILLVLSLWLEAHEFA